jgi:hypothetical protein
MVETNQQIIQETNIKIHQEINRMSDYLLHCAILEILFDLHCYALETTIERHYAKKKFELYIFLF